jgi:PAS domain S-box-containing protein
MSIHPALRALVPLVDSLHDGALVCDADARVVLVNSAAARLLRAPAEQLLCALGDYPRLFVGLASGRPAALAQALEGVNVPPDDATSAADGRLRTSAAPVRDESGRTVGALITLAELTALRRSSEATEHEHAELQLRALFEAMPQLGWAARPDGWVYHYNQRWYEYTGATQPEIEGLGWRSVIDPAVVGEVSERWTASLATGEPFQMAFTLRRHDGARRWFLTRATPMRDAQGNVVRWVGINTDIHEQREAQERLESLASLALHLAAARTRTQVADVIVERGMRAAGADTCTLYILEENGTALTLIGERGVAPEITAKIRRITEHDGEPATLASVRSGTSLWAESMDDYLALFPALARQPASRPRAQAFWSVPLIVEGRPVGLLGMGFYAPRRFSPEERAFVDTFSKQSAQALLRAIRLESENEIQRVLTTTLRSIGDAVIATDTSGRVTFMNPIAQGLTGWSEQEALGLPLEQVFKVVSESEGEPATVPPGAAHEQRVQANEPRIESLTSKVLRASSAATLASHTVLLSRNGQRIPIDDSGAPIKDSDGAVLGVVLVFRDVSMEKVRAVRRAFLADAGDALASSLDYRATLATVTRLAVPRLADWCAIELIEPGDDAPQQVAVAHLDPEKVALARELYERYPPDPRAPGGTPHVIRSGQPELHPQIAPELLEASARDAEHLRIIRELRLGSAMVVPLRGRERTLGAMTFVYAESERRYTSDDLAFAEEFARRAAMAIETASSFRALEEARAREHALREEAQFANRAKDEFLATVSHELRTPLHAILGWAVTLRGRRPPEDIDRPLAVIERNARAQARLIDDVLDVSRMISGKLSLTLRTINVADAVTGAIDAATPAATAKRIALQLDVAPEPLEVTADPERIQQVVWNLVTNAVKFTAGGGLVTVAAYREAGHVCIAVTDTGEGIPAAALPRIFEPFQQADASITRRHGGLGLGLAVVKQLVTAHGGTVRAESEGAGRGARFTVCLPALGALVKPSAAFPSAPPSPPRRTPESARPREAPRLDALRVLVVDDEEDARTLLGEQLVRLGAELHVAASAEEALQLFTTVRPDVVVSDIGMPMVDGYALVRRLRALAPEQGASTPSIALTAYTSEEDARRALAAGFDRHVAKPTEPAKLAHIIAELCGRSPTS